jgi:hypothetical protein
MTLLDRITGYVSLRPMLRALHKRLSALEGTTDKHVAVLSRISRCDLCGCVLDATHGAVTVARKPGTQIGVAICRWDAAEASRRGYKRIERESA